MQNMYRQQPRSDDKIVVNVKSDGTYSTNTKPNDTKVKVNTKKL